MPLEKWIVQFLCSISRPLLSGHRLKAMLLPGFSGSLDTDVAPMNSFHCWAAIVAKRIDARQGARNHHSFSFYATQAIII